jgi:hypothetical protein
MLTKPLISYSMRSRQLETTFVSGRQNLHVCAF